MDNLNDISALPLDASATGRRIKLRESMSGMYCEEKQFANNAFNGFILGVNLQIAILSVFAAIFLICCVNVKTAYTLMFSYL